MYRTEPESSALVTADQSVMTTILTEQCLSGLRCIYYNINLPVRLRSGNHRHIYGNVYRLGVICISAANCVESVSPTTGDLKRQITATGVDRDIQETTWHRQIRQCRQDSKRSRSNVQVLLANASGAPMVNLRWHAPPGRLRTIYVA